MLISDAVFEAYVPPEGDGKASLLETAVRLQKFTIKTCSINYL